MLKSGYVIIAAIFVLTVTIQQAAALKCWRCSSDTQEFCGEPFDTRNITETKKNWFYIDCSPPTGSSWPLDSAVCKKVKMFVNDKLVVTRSCYFMDKNKPEDACVNTKPGTNSNTVSCETCSTDGCNGEEIEGNPVRKSMGVHYGSNTLLALSIALISACLL